METSLTPVVLLILAVLAGLAALWQRARSGLPKGQVLSSDTAGMQEGKPLYDPRLRLAGRPDYLIQDGKNRIAVELKSSPAPTQPYDSHVIQLHAYSLLVHRQTGIRPAYGILRYRDRSFKIPFSPAAENELRQQITALRGQEARGEPSRSHNDPSRCAACGFRAICPEKLTPSSRGAR